MEHLTLGLVLLAGTLAAGTPPRRGDLNTVKELALDMAPTSFDDQYQGCSRMMEELLEELNRTEFANNSVYAKTWTLAAAEWRSRQGRVPRLPALRPEQAVALLAYTLPEPLYEAFNDAVRKAGRSREEYLGAFHFKALHFLMSEALRTLRGAQPRRCHRVYRGVRDIRFTAQHHQRVRFGHFTSTSLREESSQSFGQDTFFLVDTCYGIPIRNFSYIPKEEEVLIPPFEVFEVTNVTRGKHRAFIQLRSQGTCSTYNCEFVKEKRCKNQTCVFSAGRSVPRDPPRLWGLLLAATALAVIGGLRATTPLHPSKEKGSGMGAPSFTETEGWVGAAGGAGGMGTAPLQGPAWRPPVPSSALPRCHRLWDAPAAPGHQRSLDDAFRRATAGAFGYS